jgi:hypothetical protein
LSLGIWPSACPLDRRKALASRCPGFTPERLATFAAGARLEMLDRKVSAIHHFRLQKADFSVPNTGRSISNTATESCSPFLSVRATVSAQWASFGR